VGPGWCSLCQHAEETNTDTIMTSPFTKQVWIEIEEMIGQKIGQGMKLKKLLGFGVLKRKQKGSELCLSIFHGEYGWSGI
jgi:hypothetical protein